MFVLLDVPFCVCRVEDAEEEEAAVYSVSVPPSPSLGIQTAEA